MAIQFTNPAIGLTRTTGLVQGSAASYSWFVWFRPDTDIVVPDYQTVISREGTVPYTGIYSDPSDSNKYKLELNNGAGSGDVSTAGVVLQAGKWYTISFHRSGSFSQWEVSTIGTTTLNFSMTAAVFTSLFLGYDGAGLNKGTFAYFREWTTVLGPTDFKLEANSRVAVQTTGLITDTPLTANLLDLTINNNDWTTTGVEGVDYNFIADDPIPVGATSGDPVIITSLPYNETIAVKPTDVEFIFNQWFKYTAVSPEVYIGGWLFGALSGYTPQISIYSDAGVTEYPPNNAIHNAQQRRFQIPVVTGNDYYFSATAVFTSITSVSLLADFVTGPAQLTPPGSYFVNDDLQDFYAAVLSTVDGDNYNVLRFFPFAVTNAEQGGDIFQTNGKILCIDDVTGKQLLYSPQLAELLDTGLTGTTNGCIRRLADGSAAYSGHGLIVNRIDKDGVVGGTTWTLTGSLIAAMAPSNDETKLYVNPAGGNAPGAPVKVWDLVNNVYLTDLAAGISQYWVQNILVLLDDSILVYYFRSVGTPFTFKVIRYDPTGTILNTYTFATPVERTGNASGSLAFDYADPEHYFQIRIHGLVLIGGTSILRVKLTDGSISSQVDHVRFENGLYQGNLTATPLTKFGPSQSCPFFPLQFSPVTSQSGGIYKLTPNSSQYVPRRNDKLWLDVEAKTTEEVKIPDPFIETGAIGD